MQRQSSLLSNQKNSPSLFRLLPWLLVSLLSRLLARLFQRVTRLRISSCSTIHPPTDYCPDYPHCSSTDFVPQSTPYLNQRWTSTSERTLISTHQHGTSLHGCVKFALACPKTVIKLLPNETCHRNPLCDHSPSLNLYGSPSLNRYGSPSLNNYRSPSPRSFLATFPMTGNNEFTILI